MRFALPSDKCAGLDFPGVRYNAADPGHIEVNRADHAQALVRAGRRDGLVRPCSRSYSFASGLPQAGHTQLPAVRCQGCQREQFALFGSLCRRCGGPMKEVTDGS